MDPARHADGWDVPAFLETGETEMAAVMATATRLGLPLRRDRALDVGCGVGRVTRPMSRHFPECHGVDISPSMLERARRLSADRPACFFEMVAPDGSLPYADRSFDLVYCSRVLQHLPDRAAMRGTIAEMLRVLGPGGLLVFQVPSGIPLRRRLQPRRRAYALLRTLGARPEVLLRGRRLTPVSMLGMNEAEVRATVAAHGGRVLERSLSVTGFAGIEDTTWFVSVPTSTSGVNGSVDSPP